MQNGRASFVGQPPWEVEGRTLRNGAFENGVANFAMRPPLQNGRASFAGRPPWEVEGRTLGREDPRHVKRVCESIELVELGVEEGKSPCSICLEAFNHIAGKDEGKGKGNVNVKRLPCSHLFHFHCISEWFHRNLSVPFVELDLSCHS